jgi:hypothetical protein
MTKEEYSKVIGELRTVNQRSLNNTYIWCSIAIRSLEDSITQPSFINATRFTVPSRTTNKTISRDSEKVKEVINKAITQDLYFSVFVFLVAQVEAFLNDLISLTLKFDNRRLKTRIQGVDHTKKIDVDDVVDCDSKEELINSIIKKELMSLFYASPAQQFEYMRRVIGVELPDETKNSWIEFKATRDLIVHNSGIINDVYLNKCGSFARGRLGEQISIDKKYFERAIAMMKSLIGKSVSLLQSSAKKSAT